MSAKLKLVDNEAGVIRRTLEIVDRRRNTLRLLKTAIRYVPSNPCKVLTSFKPAADVVGMTTGDTYTIKGKGTLKYDWFPGDPISWRRK